MTVGALRKTEALLEVLEQEDQGEMKFPGVDCGCDTCFASTFPDDWVLGGQIPLN